MPWTTGQKIEAGLLVTGGVVGIALTILGIKKGLDSINNRPPPPPQ